jgi:hypothetical protein
MEPGTRRGLGVLAVAAALTSVASCSVSPPPGSAPDTAASSPASDAMGTQYDTTHVYVTPGSIDAFAASWAATFGGSHTAQSVVNVTPTPSETKSELVFSPVGYLSVFDFQTPTPFPFGAERTGWLLRNFDQGVASARADGAAVVVTPFPDPIGRDAIVQFPGGINTQLYWHTKTPSYPALATVPENRVYLSPDTLPSFENAYLKFTGGKVTSARERGRSRDRYTRPEISSDPNRGTVRKHCRHGNRRAPALPLRPGVHRIHSE